jgi:hypothetical protein
MGETLCTRNYKAVDAGDEGGWETGRGRTEDGRRSRSGRGT